MSAPWPILFLCICGIYLLPFFGIIERSRAWLEAAQSAARGRHGVHTDVTGGVVLLFWIVDRRAAFAGAAAKTEIKSAIARLMEP
jgi:hypothetical protein